MNSKHLYPYYLLAWFVTILFLQQLQRPAHIMQQITGTSTATLDASNTPTNTLNPRETLAVTATITDTLPVTNTPTISPTAELTVTGTFQPTNSSTAPSFPTPTLPTFPTPTPPTSQTLPPPSVSPVQVDGSPTATFIPFPTLTMIFPEPTANQILLSSERKPDDPDLAKGKTNSKQELILPVGIFLIIVLLWLGLVLWFLFIRRQVV